ncbi:hypothetical protein B0H13DRAFT_126803 [Mycena leptocephala]|nr:hypothetical protein B0H13DRAFT_126803 [Mycena leptocephala]
MADIVGLVASILQLVDAVVKARDYIQNFRNAPKDQQQLLQEIKSLDPLIRQLDERIRSSHAAGLASFETPLNELKEMIERLTKDIVQKSSSRLTWSMWGKEDVQKGLSTIERFKTLLSVWLGADISDSAQVIECAISDLSEEQRVDHRYIITSLNRSARDQQDHHDRTTSTLKSATEEQRINHNYLLKSVRGIARNQEQYLTAEERDRIIEWYSSINFFLRQADILNSRQPGTGQWLLEHHLFKKWKSGVTKTIWCRGMPGAGKTVLVSIVVDNLRAELESETIGIAVIYLSHKETETQSPTNL